jgi:hypothetical protein
MAENRGLRESNTQVCDMQTNIDGPLHEMAVPAFPPPAPWAPPCELEACDAGAARRALEGTLWVNPGR